MPLRKALGPAALQPPANVPNQTLTCSLVRVPRAGGRDAQKGDAGQKLNCPTVLSAPEKHKKHSTDAIYAATAPKYPLTARQCP